MTQVVNTVGCGQPQVGEFLTQYPIVSRRRNSW